jgi:hypothetical protein
MQHLPPTREEVLLGRILNKRVLEAIVGVWRETLDEQNIGFRKLSSAACSTVSPIPVSVRRRP